MHTMSALARSLRPPPAVPSCKCTIPIGNYVGSAALSSQHASLDPIYAVDGTNNLDFLPQNEEELAEETALH